MSHSPSRLPRAGLLLLIPGLLGVAALTFPATSATIVWDIRWYPLHLLTAGLVAAGCLLRFVPGRSGAGAWVGLGLTLIAAGLAASAFAGPFPERALIYGFPTLIALWCGACLLLGGGGATLRGMTATREFQWTIGGFLLLFCGVSLYRFGVEDVLPLLRNARTLDESAGGGLYRLYLAEKLPELRNAHPFGHANYVSGFLLLALPLLLPGVRTPAARGLRAVSVLALCLGVVALFATQSRNALAGAVVAVAAWLWWSRRGRSLPIRPLLGLLLAGGLLFALSPRLNLSLLTVSPGRLGIWEAAWRSGLRFFPFGSGEGLAPEMLQVFSPTLSAVWPGAMQFHQTWLHLWAVGGALSLVGALLLTGWLLWTLLTPGRMPAEDRIATAPSVAALAATGVVMWADYQLDILPIALLLMLHLGLLAAGRPSRAPGSGSWDARLLLLIPALALALSVSRLPDSVRSRRHIDRAGAAFEQHQTAEVIGHYLAAFDAVEEPYPLNAAGRVLASDPARRQEAIDLFNRSLALWEPQAIAHDYLTGLWSAHDHDHEGHTPDEHRASLEQAFHHARRRAELAPELRGAYLDPARIGHQLGRPREEIEAWLTMELLERNPLLFPSTWESYLEITGYREQVVRRLADATGGLEGRTRDHATMRLAWLEALGQLPAGVEVPVEGREVFARQWERSTTLGLLREFCDSEPGSRREAMRRLLVFALERPMPEGAADEVMGLMDPDAACVEAVLTVGRGPAVAGAWNNAGIMARHPYSIPMPRPQPRPNPLGALFLQDGSQRVMAPVEAAAWLGVDSSD